MYIELFLKMKKRGKKRNKIGIGFLTRDPVQSCIGGSGGNANIHVYIERYTLHINE